MISQAAELIHSLSEIDLHVHRSLLLFLRQKPKPSNHLFIIFQMYSTTCRVGVDAQIVEECKFAQKLRHSILVVVKSFEALQQLFYIINTIL